MLLFRSEEHITRWCNDHGINHGASISPETAFKLATAWFGDRQDPGWRRKTAAEAEATFRALGLVGDFWKLT